MLTLCLPAAALSQDAPASAPAADAQPAADEELEARTTAVASTLRCPVCQGESIQDSPSDLARDMRALVREQLRAGKTPEEVKAYFVGRYGEWILLEPKMTGLNILLYVFPVVLVLGGLALVVVLVRKWSSPAPSAD
ncbi:MAG: cytochrome c-type biogenesis protein CcmH [Gemmatimonadaceae bacterium]|nr:cytochrome c-type biogenesis protein CcmH [Gemmatimonadaceae bacterium]